MFRVSMVDREQIAGLMAYVNNNPTNLVDWYPFIVPYQPGQGWLL